MIYAFPFVATTPLAQLESVLAAPKAQPLLGRSLLTLFCSLIPHSVHDLPGQILNATLQVPNHFPDEFIYCNIRIEDSDSEDIAAEFRRAIPFIHDAVRSKTRVFVHCVAGVSRSVSLVAAYLVVQKRQRLDAVLQRVRAARPAHRLHPSPPAPLMRGGSHGLTL
jgi:protein-tyrosine phosphatase